jgi:hypothetical protein
MQGLFLCAEISVRTQAHVPGTMASFVRRGLRLIGKWAAVSFNYYINYGSKNLPHWQI